MRLQLAENVLWCRKVFRRLGFEVTDDLIQKLVQCKQWFIEQFLTLLRQILDKVNATDGGLCDIFTSALRRKKTAANINYCVRGGHKPARWPWGTSRLTEIRRAKLGKKN